MLHINLHKLLLSNELYNDATIMLWYELLYHICTRAIEKIRLKNRYALALRTLSFCLLFYFTRRFVAVVVVVVVEWFYKSKIFGMEVQMPW